MKKNLQECVTHKLLPSRDKRERKKKSETRITTPPRKSGENLSMRCSGVKEGTREQETQIQMLRYCPDEGHELLIVRYTIRLLVPPLISTLLS
ncbi:hypothetical protein E2C01_064822 [Portunus trituberculatus]|uniref:Uncharacterized protein n=1 Tax=Portunus trituberculatus TaxID=210409 RepID=A0A5B7HE31_PORTR|nr:hypothetical protein [Portunus trituberculatus]